MTPVVLNINRPLPQFTKHSWPALVNVEVGPDGLVRRYPFGEMLDDKFVPSMPSVLAGQYDEKRTPFLIDFSIRTASMIRCIRDKGSVSPAWMPIIERFPAAKKREVIAH